MLEWQIKPLSKKSAVSEREIKPGDTVVCAVFVDDIGNLDRMDFLKDEFRADSINGRLVGRWERIVAENPEADERAARRMALASSEDFFISLYDDAVEIDSADVDVIKQMLALLLERKRILRPLGRPSGGLQKYIHAQSGREFIVPQRNVDEALVVKIQSQLGSIII